MSARPLPRDRPRSVHRPSPDQRVHVGMSPRIGLDGKEGGGGPSILSIGGRSMDGPVLAGPHGHRMSPIRLPSSRSDSAAVPEGFDHGRVQVVGHARPLVGVPNGDSVVEATDRDLTLEGCELPEAKGEGHPSLGV